MVLVYLYELESCRASRVSESISSGKGGDGKKKTFSSTRDVMVIIHCKSDAGTVSPARLLYPCSFANL